MIVAITAESTSGQTNVEEFRDAETTAAAVTAFCNDYTPPLDPADWLGVDTGWSHYERPPSGYHWVYDHDTEEVVAVPET